MYTYYPKHTSVDKYTIISIDSTLNYYILSGKRSEKKDTVVVVVEKKSKQIKQKLALEKEYVFKTYGFFDAVAAGNYCHDVEDKRIWCFMDSKKDLRFTESMGNELILNK